MYSTELIDIIKKRLKFKSIERMQMIGLKRKIYCPFNTTFYWLWFYVNYHTWFDSSNNNNTNHYHYHT